jgi:uncharacterized protein YecE (DUF72 family)
VRVLVGTSGYSYVPWKGPFYPEKLPAAKMLAFYAGRFSTVEINNTFYRMPQPALLERWAAETPERFGFALKSPRQITHDKRLMDVEAPLRRFCEVAQVLGEKQGPLLFQLPPFLKKDLPRLESFLATLTEVAPQARAALEFRHASWFEDDVYAALRKGGAALCVNDSEEGLTPIEPTADWGYLRLRRTDYNDSSLAAWAERLKQQPWSAAHVFFKHEDEALGPRWAAQFGQLML